MDNYDNISNYIDSIIEKGSFIDIGTLLNMLNESTLDIENKITIVNKAHLYNLSVIKLVLKENADLKNNNYEKVDITPNYPSEVIKENAPNKTIKINVQNIYQNIKSMTSYEEICMYLKKTINPDKYIDTINCLIAHLIEEKVAIKKLQNEEYLKTKQIAHTFDDDYSKIDFLLNILYKLQYEPNVTDESKNKLIYLMTDCNNISIVNDLKSIPIEYYDSFYRLLSSIQNGNFKNFKRIGTKSDTFKNSLMEVKEHQTRIVFSQIDAHTYIILTLFLKKVDTSSDYKANLRNADSLYSKMKEQIFSELSDNYLEFLDINDNITKNLFNKLLTKDKGGDICEDIKRKIK